MDFSWQRIKARYQWYKTNLWAKFEINKNFEHTEVFRLSLHNKIIQGITVKLSCSILITFYINIMVNFASECYVKLKVCTIMCRLVCAVAVKSHLFLKHFKTNSLGASSEKQGGYRWRSKREKNQTSDGDTVSFFSWSDTLKAHIWYAGPAAQQASQLRMNKR